MRAISRMMQLRRNYGLVLCSAVMLLISLIPGEMQETPDPAVMISPVPDTTLSPTTTPDVLPAATVTVELLLNETATFEPIVTSSATIEPELTLETTAEVTAMLPPAAITDQATAVVEMTPEVTVDAEVTVPPDDTATSTLEAVLTASATNTPAPASTSLPLITLIGLAHYQNRLPDDADILVTVRDLGGSIISQALTNAGGMYQVQIPADATYWLKLEASQHQRVELLLAVNSLPPEMWLAGGDLNQDGCIDQADIDLITAAFSSGAMDTDINQDGLISAIDIAILTGNYQTTCALSMTATPQPMSLPVISPEPESAAEVTPSPEAGTDG